jgi:divinyl protochlorophyllide a 8-vinyl-reductase
MAMASAAALQTFGVHAGTIGPNAITRVIEALRMFEGELCLRRIFRAAGLEDYLARPPTEMVAECEVSRLHIALHEVIGKDRARAVARMAGHLTADYLLDHRIPRPAKLALRCSPARLSDRLLAKAIAGNAWTFVGTGTFSARHGASTVFTIRNCPICRGQHASQPYCDFYAGTFERLYGRLVRRRTKVTEVSCQATGDDACRFAIDF